MPYTSVPTKNIIYTARLYILYAMLGTILLPFLNINFNSICIILFLVAWLFEGNFLEKWGLLKKDKLFIGYLLYFLMQVIGILQAPNFAAGWSFVESKLGFLILPAIFCSSSFLDEGMRKKTMLAFSISLTVASLYCLGFNVWKYEQTHNIELFFYHNLVKPLDHHAIYFSVYIFISLAFLLQEGDTYAWMKKKKWILIAWICYFIGLIILLSSKMVLSVLLLFLLYVIALRFLKKRKRKQALLLAVMVCAALVAVFLFNNPVKKRFDGLTNSSIVLLKKEKYGPGENFNGLEFRLLLWRFTYEILRDNHAFIMGVGPANAQPRLIQKYLDMNMYAGDKSKGTTGYLAYNCHNQFLQISLQSGIIGLIIFLFWCYAMLEKTIKEKNPVLTAIVLIIFIFFISESVFERQYGMILCTVFPLLYLYTTDRQTSKS